MGIQVHWQDGMDGVRCQAINSREKRCPYVALRYRDKEGRLFDLQFCFRHVPDEQISLAEKITGRKRCSAILKPWFRDVEHLDRIRAVGQRCGSPIPLKRAKDGVDVCFSHERNPVEVLGWARKDLHDDALKILEGTLNDDALEGVIQPRDVSDEMDPLDELLIVAGEMREFKNRIAGRVAELRDDELRYEHDKSGEQLRAEVQVYQNLLDKYASTLVKIARLNIDERQMRITERQAAMIEMAITGALADIGAPLELQDKAREAVVMRLAGHTSRKRYAAG